MIDSWKIIKNEYLDYLRQYEQRIPLTDYGTRKMKPFFGALFEIDNLIYVTQVSSPKPRHMHMKNSLDFQKYYIKDHLAGVVNLNYMFPVPQYEIANLDYAIIDNYKTFDDIDERNKYIHFLKLQLVEIRKLGLEDKAKRVYNLKQENPQHIISLRSFDFKTLERYAKLWNNGDTLTSYLT